MAPDKATGSAAGDKPAGLANWKRLSLISLSAVVLIGGAVAGYLAWRPRAPVLPAISIEGLDPEVVSAIQDARAKVEADPKSSAAWGRLGIVLFAQDRYSDCIPILTEAERLDPQNPRWPYFRGLALILQKPDEGLALLKRAAGMSPRNLTLKLRLAEESLKRDRISEAENGFRAILAEHPENPRALLGVGQIFMRQNRWQEAIAPLKAAADHPTAQHTARIELAKVHRRLGDTALAEAEDRRAAEARADVAWPDQYLAEAAQYRTGLQPRIDQALQLLNNKQISEARALIDKVLTDHPRSDEAHLTKGKVLIREGSFAEAELVLQKAIDLNPKLVDGHFLLGGVQMIREDFASAEKTLLRAVNLKPTHGLAHFNLGQCRRKLGRRNDAVQSYLEAVRHRPDLAVAHVALGEIHLEDGKFDQAVTALEAALQVDASNERARTLLEQARAKKGKM